MKSAKELASSEISESNTRLMIRVALLENNKELTQGLDTIIERHINHITKLINSLTQPLHETTQELTKSQEHLKLEVSRIKSDIRVHKKTLAGYTAAAIIVAGILEFFITVILDNHKH